MFFKSFYTFIFFIIFSALFGIATLIASFVCEPKTNNPNKKTNYECGIIPIGNATINFSIKYYLYAILFIIFEIETIFLFPIATAFHKIETFILVEILLFILTLAIGFIYAYKKKLLEWK